jgi:hypothetical protein
MNQRAEADRAAHAVWRDWQNASGTEALVAAAVLAPSPHNTQPWRFRFDPVGVDVVLDQSRRLGAADPTDRELQIALGCAVENLEVAAGAQGLSTQARVVATDPPTVRVDLTPAATETSELFAAIGGRHTNRGPYTSVATSIGLLEELSRHAAAPSGVSIRWLTDWSERDAFGQILIEAAEAVVADVQQSEDYFRWFRRSVDEITLHRDGLNPGVQGLGSLQRTVAKALPPATRAERDQFWLKQTRTVHTATAAAYGLLLTSDPGSLERRVAGGRLFERLQLGAALRGLAFHPMSQITQRIDRDQTLGRVSPFEGRVASVVGTAEEQLLISFRVGYPVRPGRPSPRRPVDAFLS